MRPILMTTPGSIVHLEPNAMVMVPLGQYEMFGNEPSARTRVRTSCDTVSPWIPKHVKTLFASVIRFGCGNCGLLSSDATSGSCVQLRIAVESTTGCEMLENVNAVSFWKNSRFTSRGLALTVAMTPLSSPPDAPNANSTLRMTHAASTEVSLKMMLLQSPACGAAASLGVLSPP